MALDIREEIPIRSFSISAYVVRVDGGRGKYLILRRISTYLRASWQQVSGRIEPGELSWQAAPREIHEETGLMPTRFYSADQVEIFYEHRQNCVNVVPVFVGFVEGDPQVVLSPDERNEFRWISVGGGAAVPAIQRPGRDDGVDRGAICPRKGFRLPSH